MPKYSTNGSSSTGDTTAESNQNQTTNTSTPPTSTTPTDADNGTDGSDGSDTGTNTDGHPISEEARDILNAVVDLSTGHQRALFAATVLNTTTKAHIENVTGYSDAFYYQMTSGLEDHGVDVLHEKPRREGSLVKPIMTEVAAEMYHSNRINTDLYARKEALLPTHENHPGYDEDVLDDMGLAPEDLLNGAARSRLNSTSAVSPQGASEDAESEEDQSFVAPSERYECSICRRHKGPLHMTSPSKSYIRSHITSSDDRYHRGRSGTEAGVIRTNPTEDGDINSERTEGDDTTTGLEQMLSQARKESLGLTTATGGTAGNETTERITRKVGNGSYSGPATGISDGTPPVSTLGNRAVKHTGQQDTNTPTGSDDESQDGTESTPIADGFGEEVSITLTHEDIVSLLSGEVSEDIRKAVYQQVALRDTTTGDGE